MADGHERALFEAAFSGDGARVAELLELGASLAARNADGSTVLYLAASHGGAWLVGVLLAAGAPPDAISGGDGEGTALCAAACWGRLDVLRTLLAGGADPNVSEFEGFTPLIWAVTTGWQQCAQNLLEAGADPNAASGGGSTPLHYAAERGSSPLARLLLRYGARPDVTDAAGRTPSDLARAWLGKDVEAELRHRVLEDSPPGSTTEARHTILVEANHPDGRVGMGSERECGHAEIVELLRPE